MNLADIDIGPNAPELVRAVVEIPRRSRNKYIYDLEWEVFRLKRVMHAAVQYPTAYGFIPQTRWDDNEPLDVMVLCDEALSPGVIIDVRPIGLLAMQDEDESDSKVLSVPVHDPRYADVRDIENVSTHTLKEIEHFFETYKNLERKHVRSFGWSPAAFARQAILRGRTRYAASRPWSSKPDA